MAILPLLFLPPNLYSQTFGTQTGRPSEHTTVRTTVHLVLEDAVVTDKHGKAVADLFPSDFTIFENGKQQKIIHFEFHQPPVAIQKAGHQMKSSGATNPAKQQAPDSEGALTIIVLDALNTPWPDQAYARRKMLEFAKKQPSDERVAVYGLTSSLFLLQDFTTDSDLLRRALEKSRSQDTALAADNPEKDVELPTGTPVQIGAAMRRMELDQARFRLDERVNITLLALQQIASRVAAYPQRKNLVWLTGGFPIDLYHNVVAMLKAGDKMDEASNQMVSYSERIKQTANALAAAHVAVYPVDAAGAAHRIDWRSFIYRRNEPWRRATWSARPDESRPERLSKCGDQRAAADNVGNG